MVDSFKISGMNGLSINVYRNYIFIRTVFLLEILFFMATMIGRLVYYDTLNLSHRFDRYEYR